MATYHEQRRIATFLWHEQATEGLVEDNAIVAILDRETHQPGKTNPHATLDRVRLLPPCRPNVVVAIGRNYVDHAAQMGVEVPTEPLIFLKPNTSVIASGEAIVYPSWVSSKVEFEGELAVVIGEPCFRVSEAEAMSYVLGYTCANDVTARDLQRKDGQWARGKGFNTFCPLGPVLATGIDASDLRLITRVNGQVLQDAHTSELIFGIPRLISHISAVMTLQRGDVILTGSPAGVAPIVPGDVVEVEIERIGTLRNPVVSGE